MEFKVGDIIEFCGQEFEVLECYDNTSGRVRENCEGGCIINNFYWTYSGEDASWLPNKMIILWRIKI